MILGKRPRPPIKRTTSMTEVTLNSHDNPQRPPYEYEYDPNLDPPPDANRFLTATRNSADHMETPHFLTLCHLCNRRLISGRDIFMYRGDSAFCSLECRQQQMNEDEKKDKKPSPSATAIISQHSD